METKSKHTAKTETRWHGEYGVDVTGKPNRVNEAMMVLNMYTDLLATLANVLPLAWSYYKLLPDDGPEQDYLCPILDCAEDLLARVREGVTG